MEPGGGMLGHATPAKALCLVSVASYGRRTALEAPGQPSQAAHSPAQETTKLQLVYRAEKQVSEDQERLPSANTHTRHDFYLNN